MTAGSLLKTRIQDFLIDSLLHRGFMRERVEVLHLQTFLRRYAVDCVFDVGANDGGYGRRLRRLGYAGRIISFEPIPEVCDQLRRAAAGDPLWEVRQEALDEESRTVSFNVMSGSQFSSLHAPNTGAAANLDKLNSVERTVTLQTRRLDDAFPELQAAYGFRRPFLKLDTQGHDLSVFRGGANVVSNFVGLQSEMALTPLYKDAPLMQQSMDAYMAAGFRPSGFLPSNAGHFPHLHEIDCVMFNPAFTPERP